MKIDKAERRDKKIAKRRHGMRVSGTSVRVIARIKPRVKTQEKEAA